MDFKILDKNLFPEDIQGQFKKIFYIKFAIFITEIVDNEEKLSKSWDQLENFAAGFIQNDRNFVSKHFEDPQIIWDMYIVLFTKFEPDAELKYEIENNRYFCKKIVKKYRPELSISENLQRITLFATFENKQPDRVEREDKYFFESLIKDLDDIPDGFMDKLKNSQVKEYSSIVDQWLERFESNV
jgi:hypothetical protein